MENYASVRRSDHVGPGSEYIDDPFANPASNAVSTQIATPAVPEPCAQPSYDRRSSPHAAPRRNTDVPHDGKQTYDDSRTPYKTGSLSSAGHSTITTQISSVDLEKANLPKECKPKRPSRDSRQSKHSERSEHRTDPEKAMDSARPSHLPANELAVATSLAYSEYDENDRGRRLQEDNAVKILLFLSAPCVVLSVMNAVWACIALAITTLTQPVRLCAKRPSFGQQLAGLLGPSLNLHLRCLFTPLPPHANEDASYHSCTLVLVHMLSPFLSFCVMLASWTLSIYWLSSMIVGDPAGQDKRDDGRETVLGLRGWWEQWLLRSVKEE